MKVYPNMVNRKCKYFNNPEACRMIQEECNCYQCPIVEWEINKKDLSLMQKRLYELEKENQKLKIALADKVIGNKADEEMGCGE